MASKASSRTLTNHNEIRQWAEERGAKPAAVRATENEGDIGIIRLDFPGYSGGDALEEVGWDDWFDQFESSGLALVVQEETANGKSSNFNKLVRRDSVQQASEEGRSSTSKSSRGRSQKRRATGQSTGSRSSGQTSRERSGSSGVRSKSATSPKRAGASVSAKRSQSSRSKSGRKAA